MMDWNASLVCYPAEADRAMRTFRSELKKAVRQYGGEISDEQERIDRSFLMGFRFIYVEGEHTGTVAITYGPEKPFGAFPDIDPPFRTLHIGIEESTGCERDVETNFSDTDNSSPKTASSTAWRTKR